VSSRLAWLVVAACSSHAEAPVASKPAPAPLPVPPAVQPADAGAVTASTPDASTVPDGATVLHPVAMDGPYPTLLASCQHARPCGGTVMDDMGKVSHPPKAPTCDAVIDRSREINAGEAKLEHTIGDDEIHLAGVKCTEPVGLRYTHSEYSVYVHRSDGWWRTSEPMFAIDYNDKYCDASQVVRWNDQPGRTFLGIAAKLECVACIKQGSLTETLEMMIRIEHGDAKPVVFGPLAVGERYVQTPNADIDPQIDCKTIRDVVSLDEKWPTPDDLVLTGPASWHAPETEDGILWIGVTNKDVPSPAGSYHFSR